MKPRKDLMWNNHLRVERSIRSVSDNGLWIRTVTDFNVVWSVSRNKTERLNGNAIVTTVQYDKRVELAYEYTNEHDDTDPLFQLENVGTDLAADNVPAFAVAVVQVRDWVIDKINRACEESYPKYRLVL